MADPKDRAGSTGDTERANVRQSNDGDQAMERERLETERNRGYDEAVTGRDTADSDEAFEDVDPDSAESDVDRDDTIDEV